VEKIEARTGFPPSTRNSIVPCRYHSTSAPQWSHCSSGNKDKWLKP